MIYILSVLGFEQIYLLDVLMTKFYDRETTRPFTLNSFLHVLQIKPEQILDQINLSVFPVQSS